MNIGLIGVPGSGKTALANQLDTALNGARVIDRYVEELEKKLDYTYGQFGTYIGNLNIALTRLNREREIRVSTIFAHTVTCGTVIDTLAYMALEAANTTPYDGFERRMLSSLATVGCLYHDTFDYDVVALLPIPEEIDGYRKDLDDALVATLEAFGTDVIVLKEETDLLSPILNKVHELELATAN